MLSQADVTDNVVAFGYLLGLLDARQIERLRQRSGVADDYVPLDATASEGDIFGGELDHELLFADEHTAAVWFRVAVQQQVPVWESSPVPEVEAGEFASYWGDAGRGLIEAVGSAPRWRRFGRKSPPGSSFQERVDAWLSTQGGDRHSD